MKSNQIKIAIILFVTTLVGCSKDSENISNETSNYSISCKVNGTAWNSSNGNAAINDKNKPVEDAFLLMGGSVEGSDQSETQFNVMLQGPNVATGKITPIKGGFNGGEFIGLNYNGKDYVTNNGSANTNLGEIKFNTVDSKISGTFSGILYATTGETIAVTEGKFNVDIIHF